MANVVRINSESPTKDQWKLLAQFAYLTNIARYLKQHGFTKSDSKIVEYIAGCFRQGEAYFTAAENSPTDISPLLQYYGAATLLAGASAMLTGTQLPIREHGMKLNVPNTQRIRIADVQVLPINRKSGALQQFTDTFSRGCLLVNGESWTVEEILGSIPDLKQDFENCYPNALPYTIPIEIVRKRRGSLERIAKGDLARYKTSGDALTLIAGFSESYLIPQYGDQMDYVILHRKIKSPEIGTYSLFGQKYLQIAHLKKGQTLTPNQLVIIFMGIFALGYLSRYHPELWNPFVRSDESGEKLLIEKFLAVCQRYFPNLVLNEIYGARIQFVYETKGVLDLTMSLSERDLREMLDNVRRGIL